MSIQCGHSATVVNAIRTHDTELVHAETERVGMQGQPLGRIVRAVDPPTALAEDCLDVLPLDRLELGID